MTAISWRRLGNLAMATVPVVGLAFAGLSAKLRQDIERSVTDERTQLEDLRRDLAELPPPAAPVESAAGSALPATSDIVGTLRELESLGVAAKAGVSETRPLPTATPGQQSFRLQGSAPLANLCALLAAIENSPRLMILDSGRVEADPTGDVRYEFALSTFHRLVTDR